MLNIFRNRFRLHSVGSESGSHPVTQLQSFVTDRFLRPISQVNVWLVALAVWVVMVAFGFCVLTSYSLTAGPTGIGSLAGIYKPPSPEAVTLDRPWQLLIGLHPKCPCSNSSVVELRKLMELNSDRVRCRALVFVPKHVPRDWAETSCVAELRSIPGVITEFDYGGERLQDVGILTSGGTILYDRSDKILFQGGITPSRGHEGPNLGSESITAIVEGRECATTVTPIFGCRMQITPSRIK